MRWTVITDVRHEALHEEPDGLTYQVYYGVRTPNGQNVAGMCEAIAQLPELIALAQAVLAQRGNDPSDPIANRLVAALDAIKRHGPLETECRQYFRR